MEKHVLAKILEEAMKQRIFFVCFVFLLTIPCFCAGFVSVAEMGNAPEREEVSQLPGLGTYQRAPLPPIQRSPLPPISTPTVPSPSPLPSAAPPIPQNQGAFNPRTGERYLPSGNGVYNPATGEYYPSSGNGYVNPRTGEYYPRIDHERP